MYISLTGNDSSELFKYILNVFNVENTLKFDISSFLLPTEGANMNKVWENVWEVLLCYKFCHLYLFAWNIDEKWISVIQLILFSI